MHVNDCVCGACSSAIPFADFAAWYKKQYARKVQKILLPSSRLDDFDLFCTLDVAEIQNDTARTPLAPKRKTDYCSRFSPAAANAREVSA